MTVFVGKLRFSGALDDRLTLDRIPIGILLYAFFDFPGFLSPMAIGGHYDFFVLLNICLKCTAFNYV